MVKTRERLLEVKNNIKEYQAMLKEIETSERRRKVIWSPVSLLLWKKWISLLS